MKRFFTLLLLACTSITIGAQAERVLPTNTATVIAVGPFLDFSDGVTPVLAMTVTNVTCELFIENDSGTAPTRTAITLAASESDNDMVPIVSNFGGYYSLELTAAQLNFVGRATLAFMDPDVVEPVFVQLRVVPSAVYTALYTGSTVLATSPTTTDITTAVDASTKIQEIIDDLGLFATETQVAAAILNADIMDYSAAGTVGEKIGITSTQASIDALDADITNILEDTSTTLDAKISAIKAAVYDSATILGNTITLSDGTTQVVDGTGRTTTAP